MSESLVQLAYISTAKHPMSSEELNQLLSVARRNNARAEIGGYLTLTDTTFFQIIEGPSENVSALYRLLLTDNRHFGLNRVLYQTVQQRAFENWAMAFEHYPSPTAMPVSGFSDFIHPYQGMEKSAIASDMNANEMVEQIQRMIST
ncbi:BLUF domain-containing protein [Bowmanella sp. JS7-9]|uniref:BLUF domain-containing protein n=1 Tax=Pseudobowmanella zhangzhouensis TaxID=1537679 RepID=A0ABW1XJ73_9ALTE|nr:BLUF domain-containing protein [Bowmanella sp. JS7-9]